MFDCILIDNAWRVVNRDLILDICKLLELPKLLILDNYSHKKMFPISYKLDIEEFKNIYLNKNYSNVSYYDLPITDLFTKTYSYPTVGFGCSVQQDNYLYFVSQNDGTHIFSRTYREHIDAVRKYQQIRRNRTGKSWRDLKKKIPN